MAGGVGPLLFASEEGDSSCRGAGLGPTCPERLSGSSGSCLELVAFFMAGGVSGGVSGTTADIGGGGGEGSPSGEGLGSGGVLATTTGGAPAPSSARGPLSMAAASLGVSGSQRGRRRRPAARTGVPRRITPGPASNNSEAGALRGRSRQVAREAQRCRLPTVSRLRPRSRSLPGEIGRAHV